MAEPRAGDRSFADPTLLRHVVGVVGEVVDELRARRRPGGAAASGPGGIRLSDAERDAAAEVLRDAYADGRLDLGEFEDRLTLVHGAKLRAEIPPVLADLPPTSDDRSGVHTGWAAPTVLTAVLREVRRTGDWELPPRLLVLVRGGTALLDLRAARVRSEVVEIDVRLAAGQVVVIVPEGVVVEVRDGLTVLGLRTDATAKAWSARSRGAVRRGPAVAPPLPRVVIGGQVVAGRLVVRRPTRRERRTPG